MQLRLPRRVQIWDALLPHNPKCRHPRHLRVATILFLGGFEVALGSVAPPFEIGCWIVDVGGWMFRTANRDGSRSGPELDAALHRHVPSRNALGFSLSRPNLSLHKWLSNPNRSSTLRSFANRCGPSTCRSAWGSGSPNSSTGPVSSLPAARTTSRKPLCSRTSSPTSSAACSATPARRELQA